MVDTLQYLHIDRRSTGVQNLVGCMLKMKHIIRAHDGKIHLIHEASGSHRE